MAFVLKPLSDTSGIAGSIEIPREAGSYSVGRFNTSDLVIAHDSVSGLHARLEVTDTNGVEVVDCGSSNGTFVNGKPVQHGSIKVGDLVRFAFVELVVESIDTSASDQWAEERQGLINELNLLRAQLAADTQSAQQQMAKLSTDLTGLRSDSLEKDKSIATLQFEMTRRDEAIAQWEERTRGLEAEVAQWQAAHGELETKLKETDAEWQISKNQAAEVKNRHQRLTQAVEELSNEWREDWRFWTDLSDLSQAAPESDSEDMISIDRLKSLRTGIRKQLDLIEPIWKEHGDHVAEELKARCDDLRDEKNALADERKRKEEKLSDTEEELERVREEVDREVRRAQGLSRRHVEVEIPERYESMVIAKDREQELFLALIDRIEFFERLIESFRRSKKMKDAMYELEDFKKRLVAILEENGVEPFEIEVGSFLNLRQRREVKVFGKKGWGTRDFQEQPFRPGKVKQVIRSGYRAGPPESAVILRRVEVLVQESDTE